MTVPHHNMPLKKKIKVFQETVIWLACGFGWVGLEDKMKGGGAGAGRKKALNTFQIFFALIKLYFYTLRGRFLSAWHIKSSTPLFLFIELTNRFSDFKIAHIFFHQ